MTKEARTIERNTLRDMEFVTDLKLSKRDMKRCEAIAVKIARAGKLRAWIEDFYEDVEDLNPNEVKVKFRIDVLEDGYPIVMPWSFYHNGVEIKQTLPFDNVIMNSKYDVDVTDAMELLSYLDNVLSNKFSKAA